MNLGVGDPKFSLEQSLSCITPSSLCELIIPLIISYTAYVFPTSQRVPHTPSLPVDSRGQGY